MSSIRRRALQGIGATLVALAMTPAVARAQASDSTHALATPTAPPAAGFGTLDRIARETYLRRHAFSLDHFLEFEPGGFVVRLGPIGNASAYSRWGIGRGRARLTINGIPMNDPQDDSTPLVHMPTSGLATLSLSRDDDAPWIEGVLDIEEETPPSGRPDTYLELSKGTNAVRQRRVRFASEASKVGVDLAYDEVLNDGYAFDATGNIPDAVDYGKARSRYSTLVLRGDPDAHTHFDIGMRTFTSTTQGDLTSNTAEGRKSGHVAWLGTSVAETKVTLFARGYSSSVPDSSTENETVGALATWSRAAGSSSAVGLRAGIERTDAVQDVGAIAKDQVVRATAGADASRTLGSGSTVRASISVAGDEAVPFAWGAKVAARRDGSRNAIEVSLARSFRMPTFGERYLPAHTNATRTLAGDADVDPETAWEVGGDWDLRFGSLAQNRVRAAWIRSDDAIAFRPRTVGSETWRVAANASEASAMLFLEERMSGDWRLSSLRVLADAAVVFTTGDRVETFASVPELQANASLMFGREFFEETSALFVGAQFMSAGERHDYSGTPLPPFQVLNLVLEGRLLDARLYLQYLNVLDEAYRTQGDYLMTPRTFVYGIEWTLFN